MPTKRFRLDVSIGDEDRRLLEVYGRQVAFRGAHDLGVFPDRAIAFETALEYSVASGLSSDRIDIAAGSGRSNRTYHLTRDYRGSYEPAQMVALVSRALRFQYPNGPTSGPKPSTTVREHVRDMLPANEIADIRREAFRTRTDPSDVRMWRAAHQMAEAKRIAEALATCETVWLPVDRRLADLHREFVPIARAAGIDPWLCYQLAGVTTQLFRVPRPPIPGTNGHGDPALSPARSSARVATGI